MAAPDELKMEPEITDKSVCVWVGVCACVRAGVRASTCVWLGFMDLTV